MCRAWPFPIDRPGAPREWSFATPGPARRAVAKAATAVPATRPRSSRSAIKGRSERPSGRFRRTWRANTHSALRSGTLRAPTRTTVAEAGAEWLAAAQKQVVRTRSGSPYKPSALRSYEQALRIYAIPELGHLRLSSVNRAQIQDLVDKLVAKGLSASTVRNAILPLRAIYRRSLARSEVLVNPTLGLSLKGRGPRLRIRNPRSNRHQRPGAASSQPLAQTRPRADRPPRVPPYLCRADDRRRRQRQVAIHLHG
jgi:hypothetical protein